MAGISNDSQLAMMRRGGFAGSWIVLIAWLASSAVAFWYFELTDWRPFAPVGGSAPSALIFDAEGHVIYYGPYSDSAWRGSAGALVDPILDRALSGTTTIAEKPAARAPATRGCYCGR